MTNTPTIQADGAAEGLLACPFCGSPVTYERSHVLGEADYIRHRPQVGGVDCGLDGFSGFNLEGDLLAAWNTRPTPAPPLPDADKALVALRDLVTVIDAEGVFADAYPRVLAAARLALSAPQPEQPGVEALSVISNDGVDMGSFADARADFLTRVDAWTAERQPSIDTADGHKKRAHREQEALFRLANSAAMMAWHIRANTPATPGGRAS